MSFILDALKKSESERQRQSGPSLFEVKVAPPRRSLPVWAVVVAALLAINVIVISWMLLRHPAQPQPAAPASAAAPPPAVAASRAIGQGTAPAGAAAAPGISGSTPGPTANTAPPPATPSATPSATPPGTPSDQQAARTPTENRASAMAPAAGGSGQGGRPATPGGTAAADSEPSDTAPAVEPGAVPGSGRPRAQAATCPSTSRS